MGRQCAASELAADALSSADTQAFITALGEQGMALAVLGEAAGIPIVTPAVNALAARARAENAVVLPAGAGGGDIAYYAGTRPPSAQWCEAAVRLGLRRLAVQWGAKGVHSMGAHGH
jgi:phosphomevalonate kinase